MTGRKSGNKVKQRLSSRWRCELLKLDEGEMEWRRKGQVWVKIPQLSCTRGGVITSKTLLRLGKFEEISVAVEENRVRWRWESMRDSLDVFILRTRWAH